MYVWHWKIVKWVIWYDSMLASMVKEKICQFWCILKFILNYFFSFKKIYQVIPCLETFSGLKQASNFLNKLSQLNSIHLKRESYTFECSFVVNVIFFWPWNGLIFQQTKKEAKNSNGSIKIKIVLGLFPYSYEKSCMNLIKVVENLTILPK